MSSGIFGDAGAGAGSRGWAGLKGKAPAKGRTQNPKQYGHIPGVSVGQRFPNRAELSEAAVHAPLQKGIAGGQWESAYSIVLAGNIDYSDVDHGNTLTYTGEGGQTQKRLQVRDQSFKVDGGYFIGNRALLNSKRSGKPVRVIRGHTLNSVWAPGEGYRYDGLYRVVRAYRLPATHTHGYKMCYFDLERLPGQPPLQRQLGPDAGPSKPRPSSTRKPSSSTSRHPHPATKRPFSDSDSEYDVDADADDDDDDDDDANDTKLPQKRKKVKSEPSASDAEHPPRSKRSRPSPAEAGPSGTSVTVKRPHSTPPSRISSIKRPPSSAPTTATANGDGGQSSGAITPTIQRLAFKPVVKTEPSC